MTSSTKQVSLHGNRAYLSTDDNLVAKAHASGGVGKPTIVLPGSPDVVAMFDDFLAGPTDTGHVTSVASTLIRAGSHFVHAKGDTGELGALTAGSGGIFRMTPSLTHAAADPTAAGSGVIGGSLAWKANAGGIGKGKLRMAARVKRSIYTKGTVPGGLFIGFTDVATAEHPAYDTGAAAGIVANATDAVGFMWNTAADTGWRGVAVDGGTIQEVQLTTTTPTANTYQTFEVVIGQNVGDTGATAFFYIDGVPKGKINKPLNTSVALTPCVYQYDTGGVATTDIDWMNVSQPRDTGL